MGMMVSARATEAGIKKRHLITSYEEIPSVKIEKEPPRLFIRHQFHIVPPEACRDIMIAVAQKRGILIAEMVGERKTDAYVHARYEAIYEIRRLLGYSMPRIGAIFNRDHTTILHALREWPAKAAALGIECLPLNVEPKP